MKTARYLGPALLGMVLAFALRYVQTQTPIEIFGGLGWDGANYYRLAEQIRESRPLTGPKPYLLRLAVPWLVAKLSPQNLLDGFKSLSLVSGFLVLLFLALILQRFQLRSEIRALMLMLMVTNPWGPIRFAAFYPVLPDEPTLVVLGLFLYLVCREDPMTPSRFLVLLVVAAAGAVIREITLIAPLSFFLCQMLQSKSLFRRWLWGGLPLLCLFLVILLCRKMGISHAAIAHLFQILPRINFAVSVLSDPTKLLLGFVNGYGPIFFVAIGELLSNFKTWWGERRIFVVLLAMVLLTSLAGGSDYERFALWAYPTIYLAAAFGILHAWQRLRRNRAIAFSFFALLFGAQGFAQRVWCEIPQDVRGMSRVSFTLFSNYGRRVHLLDCWAAYMEPTLRTTLAIQYLTMLLLLGGFYFLYCRRSSGSFSK